MSELAPETTPNADCKGDLIAKYNTAVKKDRMIIHLIASWKGAPIALARVLIGRVITLNTIETISV